MVCIRSFDKAISRTLQQAVRGPLVKKAVHLFKTRGEYDSSSLFRVGMTQAISIKTIIQDKMIRSLNTIMLTSWAPHSLLFPCKEGAGKSTYLCPCPFQGFTNKILLEYMSY